jgi:hypothetical protein
MANKVEVLHLKRTRIKVLRVNATAMSLFFVIVMERLAWLVVIGGSIGVEVVIIR